MLGDDRSPLPPQHFPLNSDVADEKKRLVSRVEMAYFVLMTKVETFRIPIINLYRAAAACDLGVPNSVWGFSRG